MGKVRKTLKQTDPEKYRAICADLKSGKSLAATMRDNAAGSEAVGRIKEELWAAGDLKDWKKRTAGKAAALAERMIDKMDAELDSIKPASLPIAAAVLIDKTQLLSDSPAMVVEHRHEIGQGLGGWLGNSMHQSAPEQEKAANVVEIESISDEGGGSGEQRTGTKKQSSQQGAGGVENCAPSPPNMD